MASKFIVLCLLIFLSAAAFGQLTSDFTTSNPTSFKPSNGTIFGDLNITQYLPLMQGYLSQISSLVLPFLKAQISANDGCYQDVLLVLEGIQKFEMWALEMFDTSGKIPKNILQGTFTFLGSYPDCRRISHTVSGSGQHNHEIQGGYAMVSFKLPPNLLAQLKSNSALFSQVIPRWDMCVPRSCSPQNISDLINLLPISNLNVSVKSVEFAEPKSMEGDIGAIVSIAVLSVFGLLCVLGTILDLTLERFKIIPKDKKYEHQLNNIGNGTITTISEKVPISKAEEVTIDDIGEKDGIDNPALSVTISQEGTKNYTINGLNGTNGIHYVKQSNGNEGHQGEKEKGPGLLCQVLLAFSINRNGKKLLDCSSTSGTLCCLHGIRVLSMAWVILGHYIISAINTLENKKSYFEKMQTFAFQFITNGTLSVDSFFLLSGLLVSYLFMREVSKTGKVTGKMMGLYYFHRYWRLTPLYVIVIMFYTYLTKYLTEGAMVSTAVEEGSAQNCKDNGWTNVLYINNLYKSGQTDMCMGWSWYLANDMQFYIISPLALIPLALGYRVIGFGVLSAFFATHIISSSIESKDMEYMGFLSPQTNGAYFERVYVKPYARVGVYAIGLGLGYILYKTKGQKKLPKWLLFVGSVFCALIGLLSTYLTYDTFRLNGHTWSSDGFIAEDTLARPAFALAVSWMIFLCVNGYGGIVNSILSWKAWIPLSRLTYAAYLIHLIVLTVEMSNITSLVYLDTYGIINGYTGCFAVTYALSFIISVTIEAPCLGLEKVFIKK